MKLGRALLTLLLGLAAGQVLACYTVYDRSGRVVYNESTPPVDMSRPIHETLSARFPGAHMVFDAQADCQLVVPLAPVIASRGGTPLLTDRRTAQAMNVPYTVLQGAIVVIQPRDARAAPGVTVVPAEAPGAALPSSGTVITELREPPMTIVQSANGVTISESAHR